VPKTKQRPLYKNEILPTRSSILSSYALKHSFKNKIALDVQTYIHFLRAIYKYFPTEFEIPIGIANG
jgi:hypothetical protein